MQRPFYYPLRNIYFSISLIFSFISEGCSPEKLPLRFVLFTCMTYTAPDSSSSSTASEDSYSSLPNSPWFTANNTDSKMSGITQPQVDFPMENLSAPDPFANLSMADKEEICGKLQERRKNNRTPIFPGTDAILLTV